MYKFFLTMAILVFTTAGFADNIATIDGNIYNNVTVKATNPLGVTGTVTENGHTKTVYILYGLMNPVDQRKYGYDINKANEFMAKLNADKSQDNSAAQAATNAPLKDNAVQTTKTDNQNNPIQSNQFNTSGASGVTPVSAGGIGIQTPIANVGVSPGGIGIQTPVAAVSVNSNPAPVVYLQPVYQQPVYYNQPVVYQQPIVQPAQIVYDNNVIVPTTWVLYNGQYIPSTVYYNQYYANNWCYYNGLWYPSAYYFGYNYWGWGWYRGFGWRGWGWNRGGWGGYGHGGGWGGYGHGGGGHGGGGHGGGGHGGGHGR